MSRAGKIYIILDDHTKKFFKTENLIPDDILIVGKGVEKIKSACTCYNLKGYKEELNDVEKVADDFNGILESIKDECLKLACYPQVNDIFKFIIHPLLEILDLLDSEKLFELDVVLLGGNGKCKFISVYMANNPEVSRPLFHHMSWSLTPLLSEWLASQGRTFEWKKDTAAKLLFNKALRKSMIFTLSFMTMLKSIHLPAKKTVQPICMLYRTNNQKSSADAFHDQFLIEKKTSSHSAPVLGNAARLKNTPISFLGGGLAILFVVRALVKNIFSRELKKNKILNYKKGGFGVDLGCICGEALYFVALYAYYFSLKKMIIDYGVKWVVSTEMTSRYAVVEKMIMSSTPDTKLIGLQVGSLGRILLPLEPVHDLFIAQSEAERVFLISIGGNVAYLGNYTLRKEAARFVAGGSKVKNKILFLSQPYGEGDNKKIIKTIMNNKPEGFSLAIRPHPRDVINYQKMFPECEIDFGVSCEQSILSSFVVVGKTSTALNDCEDIGIPYRSVLLDPYSVSIISGTGIPDKNKLFTLDCLAKYIENINLEERNTKMLDVSYESQKETNRVLADFLAI